MLLFHGYFSGTPQKIPVFLLPRTCSPLHSRERVPQKFRDSRGIDGLHSRERVPEKFRDSRGIQGFLFLQYRDSTSWKIGEGIRVSLPEADEGNTVDLDANAIREDSVPEDSVPEDSVPEDISTSTSTPTP